MSIQNSELRIKSAIGRRLDSGWLLLALLLSAALAVLPMAQLQVVLGVILLGIAVVAIIAEPTVQSCLGARRIDADDVESNARRADVRAQNVALVAVGDDFNASVV